MCASILVDKLKLTDKLSRIHKVGDNGFMKNICFHIYLFLGHLNLISWQLSSEIHKICCSQILMNYSKWNPNSKAYNYVKYDALITFWLHVYTDLVLCREMERRLLLRCSPQRPCREVLRYRSGNSRSWCNSSRRMWYSYWV